MARGDMWEDLAQETLLEAWRNAHKLRDPSGRGAVARGDRAQRLSALGAAPRPRAGRRCAAESRPTSGGRVSTSSSSSSARSSLELLDRALALLPGADAGRARAALRPRRAARARSPRGSASRRTRCRCGSARGKTRVAANARRASSAASADVELARDARVVRPSAAGASSRCATRRAHDAVTFSCPDCSPRRAGIATSRSGTRTSPSSLGGLVRPAAILARDGATGLQRLLRRRRRRARCRAPAAAAPATVGRGTRARRRRRNPDGLFVACDAVRRAGLVVGRAASRSPARRCGASGASTRARGCCRGATSTSAACRRSSVRVEDVARQQRASTWCSRASRYACSRSPA